MTRLVLPTPWEPRTTILASRADDIVPFSFGLFFVSKRDAGEVSGVVINYLVPRGSSESLSLTPCMVALSRCLGNFSALATQRRDCFGASVCYKQARKWENKKESRVEEKSLKGWEGEVKVVVDSPSDLGRHRLGCVRLWAVVV